MSKTFLYIRGRGQEAQREALQAEFPQGEVYIDRKPPEVLETLKAGAGRGDLIAVCSLEAIPEITAEDYIALSQRGAGLYIQQQPYLNSVIFAPEVTSIEAGHGSRATERTAARIIERQLAAERTRLTARKEGRSAAIKAGQERTGNRGGHSTGTRPAGVAAQKEARIKEFIRELLAEGQTTAQIANRLQSEAGELHATRNTVYKYMKTLKPQEAQETETATGSDQTGAP